ncbi:MAG: peptide chain release factor N(5)-glutamine methyltransferase [Salibacteraceae bacterium]
MDLSKNTIGGVKQYIAQKLKDLYSESEIAVIQQQLIQKNYGLTAAQQFLEQEKRISESEILKTVFAIREMEKGKPLQYVLGDAEFYGFTFLVNENVLIPRPETEELCSWIIDSVQNKAASILDIGTGSGCIPITLKLELPEADITGCDVSSKAMDIAIENAGLNQASVNWLELDILSEDDPFNENEFDIIVSNPPYVLEKDKSKMETNVLDFEPHIALFVKDNDPLLFYRVIAEKAKQWLKPEGNLFFEIHESLGKQTLKLLTELGYVNLELRKDLSGRDRMIKAVLS